MLSAIDQLRAHVDETMSHVEFVDLSARLRPRIGPAFNYEADKDLTKIATRFMGQKNVSAEYIFSSLYLRILAAFERYIRQCVEQYVARVTKEYGSFEKTPSLITKRNISLTGNLLANIDTPNEHLQIDFEQLIKNLATCVTGGGELQLNAVAFSAPIVGCSPQTLSRAFERMLEIPTFWDRMGSNAPLQKLLGTKKPRETGALAEERLKEYWRRRNHLAHGGDDIALTSEEIILVAETIKTISSAIDDIVKSHN